MSLPPKSCPGPDATGRQGPIVATTYEELYDQIDELVNHFYPYQDKDLVLAPTSGGKVVLQSVQRRANVAIRQGGNGGGKLQEAREDLEDAEIEKQEAEAALQAIRHFIARDPHGGQARINWFANEVSATPDAVGRWYHGLAATHGALSWR